MAGTLYLIDSNVILRWLKPDDRDYPVVVSAIDAILKSGAVLCYTSQNVAEFWNTCTRPVDRNGYGLSPQEADRRARFFEEKLQLLPESLTVHDARLVAAMRIHGVKRILTFNHKDFARYAEVEAVHPRTTSSELA